MEALLAEYSHGPVCQGKNPSLKLYDERQILPINLLKIKQCISDGKLPFSPQNKPATVLKTAVRKLTMQK